MARSTWVAHAFGSEKLLKCHMKGKASKKLANGQNIDYSEKRKRPKGFICPCTGVKYHNIQTCLLVYTADSGERLQDHWSSGFFCDFNDLTPPHFLHLSPLSISLSSLSSCDFFFSPGSLVALVWFKCCCDSKVTG